MRARPTSTPKCRRSQAYTASEVLHHNSYGSASMARRAEVDTRVPEFVWLPLVVHRFLVVVVGLWIVSKFVFLWAVLAYDMCTASSMGGRHMQTMIQRMATHNTMHAAPHTQTSIHRTNPEAGAVVTQHEAAKPGPEASCLWYACDYGARAIGSCVST